MAGTNITLPSDTELLDHLQRLISECPHAEIIHNLDEDHEEFPVGWSIRIEGCATHMVTAPSFREVIALDIEQHNRWLYVSSLPPAEDCDRKV